MNKLLRYWAFKLCGKGEQEEAASDVMTAAATEIERLRAENARLREALDTIGFAPSGWSGPDLNECILIARKALEVKP